MYGLGMATVGLFICITWHLTMHRIKHELKYNHKILDYELASIEDYTIKGRIDKSLYRKVLRSLEKPNGLQKYLPKKNKQGSGRGEKG